VRACTHIRGIGFPHSFSIVCALLQDKTNAEWCERQPDVTNIVLLHKHYSPLCEGPNSHTSNEIHLFDDMVPRLQPSCWLNINSVTPQYEGSNSLPLANTSLSLCADFHTNSCC